MKEARVFIVYHPMGLTTFKPAVDLIRENYPQVDCILIRAFHAYWKGFEIERHLSSYDLFFSLPDVGYETNVISGLPRALHYKRQVQKIGKTLGARYGRIDVYSDNSSYLPVNILLSHFYHSGCANNIYRISRESQSSLSNEPRDVLHSIITAIYCLTLNLFKVRAIKLPGVTDFIYPNDNPINEVILENPYASPELKKSHEAKITLPEPFLLLNRQQSAERDIVVILGDTSIEEVYSQYIDNKDAYDKKFGLFFERLKSFYEGCTLLYKPHLSDRGRVPRGVDPSLFTIYEEQKNAEMLMIDNLERIKAVYAFFSYSSVSASLLRIPSYHFFGYFLNTQGVEMLDDLATKMGWYGYENPYFKKLADLDEIGCIDSISTKIEMESSWRESWLDFLK